VSQIEILEPLKQEFVFKKASQILRETRLEQHFGWHSNGRGKFCAFGILMNVAGWDGVSYKEEYFYKVIDRWFGGDLRWYDIIADMNDTNHKPFTEIAAYLEEYSL
jgi:hypothetical protein